VTVVPELVIYQAVSNAYDKPKPPSPLPDCVDYEIVVGKVNGGKKEAALWNRRKKLTGAPMHAAATLYMDGNIGVRNPETIDEVARGFLKNSAQIALFRHPQRSCAYVEIEACLGRGKITEAEANLAHDELKKIGLPKDFGLWACGVIFRRSCPFYRDFFDEWLSFCGIVCRDQIWLPAILHKRGKHAQIIRTIDKDIFKNDIFTYQPHAK
jgi:hypothetical protein